MRIRIETNKKINKNTNSTKFEIILRDKHDPNFKLNIKDKMYVTVKYKFKL